MGPWRSFKEWLKRKFFKQEMNLTFTGLQNAGKTTLVNVLASGTFDEDTIPTIGLNMRQVRKGKVRMKMWDIGGQPRFRPMWVRYARNCSVIVYIVDSANEAAIPEAKEELHRLLSEPTVAGIPLLVLGNKNDLVPHLGAHELAAALELEALTTREVGCYSISAKNSVNIDKTMEWIIERTKKK